VSTEKQTNVSIADRLQSLVNEQTDGNAKLFAEIAGIVSVTFYNYLKGRVPKADALANICIKYGVNLNWLVSGVGHKYIKTEDSSLKLDPNPEIAELLEGARKVLTSGNPIAFDALERNIRYFSHAIEVEKRMQEMEAKLAEVDELKNYVLELKRQEEAREKARLEEQLSKRKVA
jgi:transcriptional regulator with XRE-family HTH domain